MLVECKNVTEMVITNEIVVNSPVGRLKQKKALSSLRPMTQEIQRQFSPSTSKKRLIIYKGYCFGEINSAKNSPEEIYRRIFIFYHSEGALLQGLAMEELFQHGDKVCALFEVE